MEHKGSARQTRYFFLVLPRTAIPCVVPPITECKSTHFSSSNGILSCFASQCIFILVKLGQAVEHTGHLYFACPAAPPFRYWRPACPPPCSEWENSEWDDTNIVPVKQLVWYSVTKRGHQADLILSCFRDFLVDFSRGVLGWLSFSSHGSAA